LKFEDQRATTPDSYPETGILFIVPGGIREMREAKNFLRQFYT